MRHEEVQQFLPIPKLMIFTFNDLNFSFDFFRFSLLEIISLKCYVSSLNRLETKQCSNKKNEYIKIIH